MTKIIILVILALAILLIPFRRIFTSREKIARIAVDHLVIIRLAYLGLALLWLLLNENDVILSQWDAQRVGIPVGWYITVPTFFLLLYAAFPSTIVWLFPLATLALGWTLHEYKTINFLRAHMGVKTDMPGAIVLISLHVFVLALCMTVLYATGPYLRKYLQSNHDLQRIARGSC